MSEPSKRLYIITGTASRCSEERLPDALDGLAAHRAAPCRSAHRTARPSVLPSHRERTSSSGAGAAAAVQAVD